MNFGINELNRYTRSLRLTVLLLRIGSEADTLFKTILATKTGHVGESTIRTYKEKLEPLYQLSKVEIKLKWIDTTTDPPSNDSYKPFENFHGINAPPPDWWRVYNKAKHETDRSLKDATFESVVKAIGALYYLNLINLGNSPQKLGVFTIEVNLDIFQISLSNRFIIPKLRIGGRSQDNLTGIWRIADITVGL